MGSSTVKTLNIQPLCAGNIIGQCEMGARLNLQKGRGGVRGKAKNRTCKVWKPKMAQKSQYVQSMIKL